MKKILESIFKGKYNMVYKNIIIKNYNYHIRKNIKDNNGEIIILNEDKVLYKLNFNFDIAYIDERDIDYKSYQKFFQIINDIPDELAHEQKIKCFLCDGDGVIEDDNDNFEKLLKDKSFNELITHIKRLRKKNLELNNKKKKMGL